MSKKSKAVPKTEKTHGKPLDVHSDMEVDEVTRQRVESYSGLFSERTWKIFFPRLLEVFLPTPKKDGSAPKDKIAKPLVSEEEKVRRGRAFEALWENELKKNPNLIKNFNALIASKIGNKHDADELFQQAFQGAIEGVDSIVKTGSFINWFGSILKHKILDYHRKTGKSQMMKGYDLAFLDSVAEHSLDPATMFEEQSAEEIKEKKIDEMFDILQMLPEDEREVYVLDRSFGLSKVEIAERLGIHPNTVANRLERAEEMLSSYTDKVVVQGLVAFMAPDRIEALAQKAITSYMAAPVAAGGISSVLGAALSLCFHILGNIVAPFAWLTFFLIGGRVFGKDSIDKAPTLHVRRWIVRQMALCYCGITLFPALFAIVCFGSIYWVTGIRHEHAIFSAFNWIAFGTIFIYAVWLRERYHHVRLVRTKQTAEESLREYESTRKTCKNCTLVASFVFVGIFTWLACNVLAPLLDFYFQTRQPGCLATFISGITVMLSFAAFHVNTIRTFGRYYPASSKIADKAV